jgi:cytidylate kinase
MSAPRLVVSLDGPGSSGKTTAGAGAAAALDYRFCDTGVLYRGATWLALERGVPTSDGAALAALVPEMELAPDDRGRYMHVLVGGDDVTALLHNARVDSKVSEVARQPAVREALLPLQRALAAGGGIIMAGRDIGSVVLPDADLKLYLDVSVAERARRRAAERGLGGDLAAVAEIEAELRRRDDFDSRRSVAPLRVPEGAIVISGDGRTLGETVSRLVAEVRRAEAAASAAGKSG